MPYTMDEFADVIRTKFPTYASWPTDHLVSEVVTKHPEYQSWVTMDPRTAIAARAANPPVSAHGDPNSQDVSGGDVAVAGVKGLAHLAGIPTSMAEVPGAAKDAMLNVATMGVSGGLKMAKNVGQDIEQGHVPIIGRPIEALAAPSVDLAHGNAPSRDERLAGIEAGTSLAGAAALAHPATGAAISRVLPKAGAAIEAAGDKQYADALAAEGTPNRPLAESLGSQLAEKGKVMTNPKKQLGTAFGGSEGGEAATVQKFAKTGAQESQLAELQKKYHDATVTDDGQGNFVVNKPGTRSLNQQGADTLAAGMPTPEAQAWWVKAGKYLVPGGIGFKLFGIPGAIAAEAPAIISTVVKSPLWKTTSAVVKTSLGRAMQAGDMAGVVNVAAKVLGGANLEDAYGHDQALFNLMQTLPPEAQSNPVALHQALQDHEAVYVNPDKTEVKVPFHVMRQAVAVIAKPTASAAIAQSSATPPPPTENRFIGAGASVTPPPVIAPPSPVPPVPPLPQARSAAPDIGVFPSDRFAGVNAAGYATKRDLYSAAIGPPAAPPAPATSPAPLPKFYAQSTVPANTPPPEVSQMIDRYHAQQNGRTVFVDVGHGVGNVHPGKYDSGAAVGGVEENKFVGDLVARATDGTNVTMVPPDTPHNRKAWYMDQGGSAAGPIVSFHANQGGGDGSLVLYADDADAATVATAKTIASTLSTTMGRPAKAVPETMAGRSGLAIPSVGGYIVELGFLDNARDLSAMRARGVDAVRNVLAVISNQKTAAPATGGSNAGIGR